MKNRGHALAIDSSWREVADASRAFVKCFILQIEAVDWLEAFDDLIHPGLERSECECLFEKRERAGILAHCLVVFVALPSSVHRHLRAIEAAVKGCGDESGRMTYEAFARVDQEIDETLLVVSLHCENVDEHDAAKSSIRHPSSPR